MYFIQVIYLIYGFFVAQQPSSGLGCLKVNLLNLFRLDKARYVQVTVEIT